MNYNYLKQTNKQHQASAQKLCNQKEKNVIFYNKSTDNNPNTKRHVAQPPEFKTQDWNLLSLQKRLINTNTDRKQLYILNNGQMRKAFQYFPGFLLQIIRRINTCRAQILALANYTL